MTQSYRACKVRCLSTKNRPLILSPIYLMTPQCIFALVVNYWPTLSDSQWEGNFAVQQFAPSAWHHIFMSHYSQILFRGWFLRYISSNISSRLLLPSTRNYLIHYFNQFSKMSDIAVFKMSEVSLKEKSKYERTPFGKEMLKHFLLDQTFKNLNHGTCPSCLLLLHESKLV